MLARSDADEFRFPAIAQRGTELDGRPVGRMPARHAEHRGSNLSSMPVHGLSAG